MVLDHEVDSLLQQIAACETQLRSLKSQLAEAEAQAHASRTLDSHPVNSVQAEGSNTTDQERATEFVAADIRDSRTPKWPLGHDEYKRYGRQLIMPEIGLQGQLRLRAASVLIVGCGGLGCPAAAYLAGAGIGTLGLVDGDTVEESNLHRQILHNTSTVGMSKVDSAMKYLKSLNPCIKYVPHRTRLSPDISLEIFQNYDLVLDCTDTPASRYLISDTCVLLGIPLVSASALRTEGQLMVLNYPPRPSGDPKGGPCYRCVFPKPPPAESVISCGDGGILGPVVGVMGVLQALEAIKLITAGLPRFYPGVDGIDHNCSTSTNGVTALPSQVGPPSLLLFSTYSNPPFRSIRLRSRRPRCASCSSVASITSEALTSGSMDYVQFCGAVAPVSVLKPGERISVQEFANETPQFSKSGSGKDNHPDIVIVDVREKVQFDLCSLDNSINVPFSEISRMGIDGPNPINGDGAQDDVLEPEWLELLRSSSQPIYTVCRLGNDSQLAVRKFKELGLDQGDRRWIGDIKGGLRAWREEVDHGFPEY